MAEVIVSGRPVDEKSEEKEYGKFDKWEIECAVDTLIRASEIQADEEKMKYIRPLLEKKVQGLQKAVSSLSDLKTVRQKKFGKED